MSIKKTRSSFTLAEKIELFHFKRNNPKQSYDAIGKFFTEKWGKPLSRQSAARIYSKIQSEKETGIGFNTSDQGFELS